MKLLSELQTGVQQKGRETNLSLSTADNLTQVNSMYRGFASALPWPELTVEDTSISTSATDGRESWPTDLAFLDVLAVEIQDGDDSDDYRMIHPVPDMRKLNRSRRKAKQSVPDFYFRLRVAGVDKVELVPVPKYTGKTVRITGIKEPNDLVSENSRTVFLLKLADDALEHIIAAHFQEIDGMTEGAGINLNNATRILRQIFGKEVVPDDLSRQIAGA